VKADDGRRRREAAGAPVEPQSTTKDHAMNIISKSLVFALLAAASASVSGCAVSSEPVAVDEDEHVAEGSAALAGTNTLRAGELLAPGQALVSANGRFQAILQSSDSHFVIYDRAVSPPVAVWSTPVYGATGWTAVMQADGNFVIYSGSSARWATHTNGPGGAQNYLRLEDNGILTMYREFIPGVPVPMWKSIGLNAWTHTDWGTGAFNIATDSGDLGVVDNAIKSLTNSGITWVTVYSGSNYTGRCQEIPPGAEYANLDVQDLGPAQISSMHVGRYCPTEGVQKSFTVENLSSLVQRYRLVTNEGDGAWSGATSNGTVLKYNANINWLCLEKQSWFFGWISDEQYCYNPVGAYSWTRDGEHLVVDDAFIDQDYFGSIY
jgi:hypothetical protein